MWIDILTESVHFGIISLLSYFVIRKFIEHSFSKELEKFKTELEKEAMRQRITYQKLHIQRADAILNVYQQFDHLQCDLESLTNPGQGIGSDENIKFQKARKTFDDLKEYYYQHRIFFEESFAVEIDRLLETLFKEVFVILGLILHKPRGGSSSSESKHEIWNLLQGRVMSTRHSIEEKFRILIGVNN